MIAVLTSFPKSLGSVLKKVLAASDFLLDFSMAMTLAVLSFSGGGLLKAC